MANSTIIGKAKNKIIKELIKDEEIVRAIGSSNIKSPEKLIGTHIFNYYQNPNTINTVETFIIVTVNIPRVFSYGKKNTFLVPTIEFLIVSHERHMEVSEIPKITDNRNDYISTLIDKKFNGTTGLGIGEMNLVENSEGSFQKDYVFRKMIFEVPELNRSLCEDE